MLNKERELFQYKSGDLVYIVSPLTSQLRTLSRRFSLKYVGPLVVYGVTDPKSFLLCTLDGTLLLGLLEHERLKLVVIRTSPNNITNFPQFQQVYHVCMKLNLYTLICSP